MQRSVWGRQMLLIVFTVLGRPSFLGTTQNPQTLWSLDRRARSPRACRSRESRRLRRCLWLSGSVACLKADARCRG